MIAAKIFESPRKIGCRRSMRVSATSVSRCPAATIFGYIISIKRGARNPAMTDTIIAKSVKPTTIVSIYLRCSTSVRRTISEGCVVEIERGGSAEGVCKEPIAHERKERREERRDGQYVRRGLQAAYFKGQVFKCVPGTIRSAHSKSQPIISHRPSRISS